MVSRQREELRSSARDNKIHTMFKTPEGRGFPGFSVKIAKGILKVPGRSVSLLKETDNGDGGVERFVCMSWEMLCIEKSM